MRRDLIVRQDLDGDGAMKASIGSAEDFAHTAGSDGSFDFVRTELPVRSEHRLRRARGPTCSNT